MLGVPAVPDAGGKGNRLHLSAMVAVERCHTFPRGAVQSGLSFQASLPLRIGLRGRDNSGPDLGGRT